MLAGTKDRAGNMSKRHRTTPRRATGFTLIEMMVVIGLVALLAAMALPSIVSLLSAGADAQAYNLIAAQLTFARALAIERVNFAGVHCQIADAPDPADATKLLRPKQEDVCYSGVVLIDDANTNTGSQKLFTGYTAPKPVPGGIGLGQVVTAVSSGDTATVGTSDTSPYTGNAGDKVKFTTFTVVFTASGTVVRTVDGGLVVYWGNDPLFRVAAALSTDIAGRRQLWDLTNANNHYGATAIALFEMRRYAPMSSADRLTYLNASAQLLPLNTYTGQLYQRE
jgi:prepilin-type N-terminal cleavage/methylation domain-containing protein